MIIPAFVVGMIFTLIHGEVPITEFFTRPTKMGYWFTFALFNMLVIYYSARCLNARRGTALELFTKRLFTIAIISFFALSDLSALGYVDTTLTLSMTFKYFHYFAFGAMCSCRREWFERTMGSGMKMAVVIAGLFILSWWVISFRETIAIADNYVDIKYLNIIHTGIKTIIGYCGILTVFGLFRRYGEFFSENRHIGKPLQFVGRNTLDVYLLHYFVLLGMPAMLRPYIVETDNILVTLVVGMTVAIAAVALSLLISRVIRLSDHLAYYLLGARDVTLNRKSNNN
jgi:peptidoglycan/LPS O-acetylase OafA/YrhL